MRPWLFSYLDAANIGSLRRRLNHDDELSLYMHKQSDFFVYKIRLLIAYAAGSWIRHRVSTGALISCKRCGRSFWASGIGTSVTRRTYAKFILCHSAT